MTGSNRGEEVDRGDKVDGVDGVDGVDMGDGFDGVDGVDGGGDVVTWMTERMTRHFVINGLP